MRAILRARELGIVSIALSGRGGGRCAKLADISLVVPSDDGARVQEVHGLILHSIIETIESEIFGR